MAFVNEYIPADDVKKYGIEEIDRRFLRTTYQPDWTIDRERNIYLRQVASGREEFASQKDYTFYWGGEIIVVRLDESGGGVRGGEGWCHYKLIRLDLPGNLQGRRKEVLSDLKEALAAYKDAGVYSATSKHTATFEF
ncbi:hypothetical protein [Pseudomonas indica]|uniref:hypothetical protein n=1 Tax=Pseudomonas indica TaxID=137658 RepID=UPI000A05C148|nr:hypothetical protein [Pseudomonas indica]